jgi:site-specific recombinase XerD
MQEFLASQAYTGSTLTVYRQWLQRFQVFCEQQSLTWQQCQPQDLERFKQNLLWGTHSQGKLYSPNTVDQALRVLRHLYRWAFQTGQLLQDPTSAWVLPRPPQPESPLLSRAEALQLLNLPDLSGPLGQRDQLLLELIYTLQYPLRICIALTPTWSEQFEPVKASWERYMGQGRQALRGFKDSPVLMLTRFAGPFLSELGLQQIVRRYGRKLGLVWQLNARILRRSAQDHQTQLGRRHSRALKSGIMGE